MVEFPQTFEATTSRTDLVERLAMFGSMACMVHCLALPWLIALLPVIASAVPHSEAVHWWVLAFAAPSACLALYFGWRQHGRLSPVGFGLAGLMLLFAAMAWFADTALETPITVTGSTLLIAGHAWNWRLRHMPRQCV